jgi:hypothetical protein
MPLTDLQCMAHLFRRAGFGATREELERYAAQGYEAVVLRCAQICFTIHEQFRR